MQRLMTYVLSKLIYIVVFNRLYNIVNLIFFVIGALFLIFAVETEVFLLSPLLGTWILFSTVVNYFLLHSTLYLFRSSSVPTTLEKLRLADVPGAEVNHEPGK